MEVPPVDEGITSVVHVDPTAPLSGANGSAEHPFPTLQLAFDFAQEGSWILLHPGVHSGPLSITKAISLKGCGPDEVVITASPASPSILTINASGIVSLEGLSLTGGTLALHILGGAQAAVKDVEIHDVSGVGILAESGSALTLNQVRIRDILKDKINPGIYPGSGIITDGSLTGENVDIHGCSATGVTANKCTLSLTDSQIAHNDGGGLFATDLYDGSALLNTHFDNNAFRSISLESGLLQISDTTVEGTRPSKDTTANLSAIYLVDGASVSLNKVDLFHDESGFAMEMNNAFVDIENMRLVGSTPDGLMIAKGAPFSTPASITLSNSILQATSHPAVLLTGPIQASLQSVQILGHGGIQSEGPSTFIQAEEVSISLEAGTAIAGKSGTYLTLSRSFVSTENSPLISLSDSSTLTAEFLATQAQGPAVAISLDESTGTIRHHQHQGGLAAWHLVGATSDGNIEYASSQITSFAAALVLDNASLSISHTEMDSYEPQWLESGPFSVVGTNKATVELKDSRLGVIRMDHAHAGLADCSLRALHMDSPSAPVDITRTEFAHGEQAAIHLVGETGVLQGESISMTQGKMGIALDKGASATLKHVDILDPTGVGIALLGGILSLDDVLISKGGDHGVHATAPDQTSTFNNVWIDQCAGAGIWAEGTELLLESTWVSQTRHGGLSGEGDGLVASDNAHVVMGSGGLVLNARAGALFQDASGIVAGMTLDENGGEHLLDLVLQGDSDVDWTGLAIKPIEPDEEHSLALPLLSFAPPQLYPLMLPEMTVEQEESR